MKSNLSVLSISYPGFHPFSCFSVLNCHLKFPLFIPQLLTLVCSPWLQAPVGKDYILYIFRVCMPPCTEDTSQLLVSYCLFDYCTQRLRLILILCTLALPPEVGFRKAASLRACKDRTWGWRCSSVVESLPSLSKVVSSIPSPRNDA